MEIPQPIEVSVRDVEPVVAEIRALHAYRERMQREVVALRDTLDGLASDYAEQLDANTKAAPYCAGAFNAYVTARRLHDRLLLLCEESAAEAAQEASEP